MRYPAGFFYTGVKTRALGAISRAAFSTSVISRAAFYTGVKTRISKNLKSDPSKDIFIQSQVYVTACRILSDRHEIVPIGISQGCKYNNFAVYSIASRERHVIEK